MNNTSISILSWITYASIIAFIYAITVIGATWESSLLLSLPRSDEFMAVGYYNDSIHVVGGWSNQRQLTIFSILDDTTTATDYGAYVFANNIYGFSQYYSQLNNMLFMINPDGDKLSVYNLETLEFTNHWNNVNITTNIGYRACLAATNENLFVIGGQDSIVVNTLQIFNLSNPPDPWTYGPSMNSIRSSHSCIVDSFHNLYSIGGYDGTVYLDSIERISTANIYTETWLVLSDTLISPAAYTRSVMWNSNIFVIGGYDGSQYSDMVHIIDTEYGTISLSSDRLLYAVEGTAAIVVKNTIYAFGGWGSSGALSYIQYMAMSTSVPTSTLTSLPTSTPTSHPHIESNITSHIESNAKSTIRSNNRPKFTPNNTSDVKSLIRSNFISIINSNI